ncbi:MAG TPA: AAC(3) family N-acetyltransferase [Steroidobacteraceae bacterium]|jgi:aminoglycoside 3-N-acetyltransferase
MTRVESLAEELVALGISGDGVLVVHTAFSSFGGGAGAPADLIAALRIAVGARGTLVMPSMSDDDDHPFDRERTPCIGMGVLADTFWRMPGVGRSDSPHAFAAIGPHAAEITAPHPVDVPHGLDSPIGRAHELDAEVLLLGVGHDANTTVHLAENLAGVSYKVPKYAMVMCGGQPVRHNYAEIDHCCANFAMLDSWLEARGHQQRGFVAGAPVRLIGARDVVATALEHLRENETVFLHPRGVCRECDEARAGGTLSPA